MPARIIRVLHRNTRGEPKRNPRLAKSECLASVSMRKIHAAMAIAMSSTM